MPQVSRTEMVMVHRHRVTTAEVIAGHTLLPAVKGMKYRLCDVKLIAIGGAAETATSVDIIGTQSAATVRPFVMAIAGLTQNAVVGVENANMTILAAGASFSAMDDNSAVTIGQQSGGSNLATCTHIDVILTYAAEKA